LGTKQIGSLVVKETGETKWVQQESVLFSKDINQLGISGSTPMSGGAELSGVRFQVGRNTATVLEASQVLTGGKNVKLVYDKGGKAILQATGSEKLYSGASITGGKAQGKGYASASLDFQKVLIAGDKPSKINVLKIEKPKEDYFGKNVQEGIKLLDRTIDLKPQTELKLTAEGKAVSEGSVLSKPQVSAPPVGETGINFGAILGKLAISKGSQPQKPQKPSGLRLPSFSFSSGKQKESNIFSNSALSLDASLGSSIFDKIGTGKKGLTGSFSSLITEDKQTTDQTTTQITDQTTIFAPPSIPAFSTARFTSGLAIGGLALPRGGGSPSLNFGMPKLRLGMKKGKKGKQIIKTLRSDILSENISIIRYGSATQPKPTKKLWQQTERQFYISVPTKELQQKHGKGKKIRYRIL
jgi:hypothetical protein